MHHAGVNLRYLALVLFHAYNITLLIPDLQSLSKQDISTDKQNLVLVVLAVEIAARAANCILQTNLSSTRSDDSMVYVNALDLILGERLNSEIYWKKVSINT